MIEHPGDRPPNSLAADELTTLNEFLDYYRNELLGRASGPTQEQLAIASPPSVLSLGGLIKHMATVEDVWFEHRFAGRAEPEPGILMPPGDFEWDFTSAADDTPEQLEAWYVASSDRSRQVTAAAGSLDDLSALSNPSGERYSLRWILVHMVEEYARHCGHADLIREAIDGVRG